ncbi:MAG: nucleotidyltransferase domain-containing protein [Nanoarchaeota archaeon]
MVKNKNMQEQKEIKLSPKEKIISYLIENKNNQPILTISGATFIDYKNTHNIVNNLYPDIIYKEKIGNASLIQLKQSISEEIYSVESKRTKQFLQNHKELRLILQDALSLKYPFFIVLLFGSIVKKTNKARSDIDLCVISDNNEKAKELIAKLRLLPISLEIQDFTTTEFISMLKTNENNVGKEIVKNNIIIYGIENYYRMIEPWMRKE